MIGGFNIFKIKSKKESNKKLAKALAYIYSESMDAFGNEKEGIALLTELAFSGNANAQYELYNYYQNMEGDLENAMHWLKFATQKKHPKAIVDCYYEHLEGNVDWISFEECLKGLERLAKKNDPLAVYAYAESLLIENEPIEKNKKAIKYFEKLAKQNNPEALYKMYLACKDTKREYALSLLRRSANKGNKEAQFSLWRETLYDAGFWLKKVKENNETAEYEYARLQELDFFNDYNMDEAMDSYEALVLKNNTKPVDILCDLNLIENKDYYDNLMKGLIENKAFKALTAFARYQLSEDKDIENSLRYLNIAAENGIFEAYGILGISYYTADETQGVENYYDMEKALEYFSKGAMKGDLISKALVFDEYFRGNNFMNLSEEQAISYLMEAANGDIHMSANLLGYCHYYGKYFKKDEYKAKEYFIKALSLGYAKSAYNLGRIAEIDKFYDDARDYFLEGARLNEPYSMKKAIEYLKKEDGTEFGELITIIKKSLERAEFDEEYFDKYMIKEKWEVLENKC